MRVTTRDLRLRSCAVIVAITMSGPSPSPAPAAPDDGFGWLKCDHASAACAVGADKSGSPALPAASKASRSASASTDQRCHDAQGRPAPCYDPQFGWLGSDGCYYKAVPPPSPAAQEALGGAGQGAGGWYDFVCPGLSGSGGGTRWIAGPPPVAAGASPAAVAQQAVSQLALPGLQIRMNPAGPLYVEVPTWLWIDPASWRPRSATAQVPGLSVTATATPARVVWTTGDGSTVTCDGPGTPWSTAANPRAASPTCGHTYRRSSSDAPGGVFAVSAAVTWNLAWSGGGQGGTVPALTSTSTTTVQVAQVQSVVTG